MAMITRLHVYMMMITLDVDYSFRDERALMWVITNCMFVCLLFDDYMMFDDVDYSFRGACLDVGHYLRD